MAGGYPSVMPMHFGLTCAEIAAVDRALDLGLQLTGDVQTDQQALIAAAVDPAAPERWHQVVELSKVFYARPARALAHDETGQPVALDATLVA